MCHPLKLYKFSDGCSRIINGRSCKCHIDYRLSHHHDQLSGKPLLCDRDSLRSDYRINRWNIFLYARFKH